MLYADKRFLVHVNKAETDGELHTIDGTIPVKKGYIITTDQLGNQSVISEQYFNENYAPVKKVHKVKTKRKSPFEEQYEKQLLEFGSLPSSEEDESYINGTKNLIDNI